MRIYHQENVSDDQSDEIVDIWKRRENQRIEL